MLCLLCIAGGKIHIGEAETPFQDSGSCSLPGTDVLLRCHISAGQPSAGNIFDVTLDDKGSDNEGC